MTTSSGERDRERALEQSRDIHRVNSADEPVMASWTLRIDWVDLSSVPGLRGAAEGGGRLGMTFLPSSLRGVHGVDAFLLLVEDHELGAARVPDIAAAMAGEGIDLLRFPIVDMRVTPDRDGLRLTLDDVLGRLRRGQTVVVACRGGLGRTGTIVGCLLRDGGLDAQAAIALTRASRRNTIEREEQERFVEGWEWPDREALS